MSEQGIVCVFAKPPRAGQVKTRLAAHVGDETARLLARAFFDDTWARLDGLSWARRVLASTDDEPAAFGLGTVELWLQGEGDLGDRMERVMRRALGQAPWVIALGADNPAMPLHCLERARAAFENHQAVLGPAADGGYYLLGLSRLPENLLRGLPWSSPATLAATRARLEANGLKVALIEPGFDIDELEDLRRLKDLLRVAPALAPKTFAALASIDLDGGR